MAEPVNEFSVQGRDGTESVGSLIEKVLSSSLMPKMSANQRAGHAWAQANGDVERRHTTGVFLKEGACEGLPPVLGVYVDSHACLSDFNANREIYLARLAAVGLEVSGVEFRLTRRPRRTAPAATSEEPSAPARLEPLPGAAQARVDELCRDLPESLREAASRAMALSLRRHASQQQQTSSEPQK